MSNSSLDNFGRAFSDDGCVHILLESAVVTTVLLLVALLFTDSSISCFVRTALGLLGSSFFAGQDLRLLLIIWTVTFGGGGGWGTGGDGGCNGGSCSGGNADGKFHQTV